MAGSSSLSGPSDWTLGLVRLHTCCTLSHQCAQVEAAITVHSGRDLLHGSIVHQAMYHHLQTSQRGWGVGGAEELLRGERGRSRERSEGEVEELLRSS